MGTTQYLPLFPLKIMLLPGEQTALHIFEPRYRQLLEDVEQMNAPFGIAYSGDDNDPVYGAKVQLVEVAKRYPSGESDIIVECEGVFRIHEFHAKDAVKLYPSGQVESLDHYKSWPAGTEVLDELYQLRDVIGPKAAILSSDEFRYVPRIVLSLNLSNEQKYQFVQLNNEEKQEQHLAGMLRFSRLIIEQEQKVDDGFFPN
jgi:hypothetical protein